MLTEIQSIVERVRNADHALTPDELADLLQVSRLTILRKAKQGIIPSFRFGNLIRFCPKALAAYLQTNGA